MARSWTDAELKRAVDTSRSIRAVIEKLGLVPAGGNYVQVKQRIADLKLDTEHFTGKGWLKGIVRPYSNETPLDQILKKNSKFQSHKLKKRLFKAGLKKQRCEECTWAQISEDGRIPVELDNINGNRMDNRLENLRILCPNCHSLKGTHRGRNKKRPGGGIW